MKHDKGLVLIDTNIIVYALGDDPAKSETAARFVLELGKSGRGVLSVQTLSEMYWVITRKRKPALPPELAKQVVSDYARSWQVIEPGRDSFIRAVEGVMRHSISFWDAMQWAVAMEHNVTTMLTEDLNHGQLIERVRIMNPFRSDTI